MASLLMPEGFTVIREMVKPRSEVTCSPWQSRRRAELNEDEEAGKMVWKHLMVISSLGHKSTLCLLDYI